jgi:universal stress protein E
MVFMRKIRRILVAVKDPSSRSVPAVMKAAQLAKAWDATLDLFHCISTPLYLDAYSGNGALEDLEQKTLKQQQDRLERLAKKLREENLQVAVGVEWDYPVFEAIVRRANETKADLIVAERHAGRHFAAGLLQLTDWELLRTSPVPVLLVKTGGTYQRPVVLAAVDPSHANAKPANLDERILRAGIQFSKALQGSLHAVHSYIPLPTPFPTNLLTDEAVRKVMVDVATQARRGFERTLRSFEIPKARRHLLARHPINAIEETAHELNSAIVVMGALSRSGLKRLFIGNTAESLLDTLACDFLIIKPAHFSSAVQRRRRGPRVSILAAPPLV